MKTLFSVLILGLLMALCCSAAQQSSVPVGKACSVVQSKDSMPLSIADCSSVSGRDWWICLGCSLACYVDMGNTIPLPPEQQDECYMNCMAGYGYIDFKSGPVSREIPEKRDAAVLDGVPLVHVRIQTSRPLATR